jgi:hypothetical protein
MYNDRNGWVFAWRGARGQDKELKKAKENSWQDPNCNDIFTDINILYSKHQIKLGVVMHFCKSQHSGN